MHSRNADLLFFFSILEKVCKVAERYLGVGGGGWGGPVTNLIQYGPGASQELKGRSELHIGGAG